MSGYGLVAWCPIAWLLALWALGTIYFMESGLELGNPPMLADWREAILFTLRSMLAFFNPPDGNLAFYVFTANGRHDITYLEDRGIARMAVRQNSIFGFLSTMHTAFSRRGPQTRSARSVSRTCRLAR